MKTAVEVNAGSLFMTAQNAMMVESANPNIIIKKEPKTCPNSALIHSAAFFIDPAGPLIAKPGPITINSNVIKIACTAPKMQMPEPMWYTVKAEAE